MSNLQVFKTAQPAAVEASEMDAMSGGYLPALRLVTSNSEAGKDDPSICNKYQVKTGDSIRQLGAAIDIVTVAHRFTAIDTSGEDVVIVHTQKHSTHEVFKKIKAVADRPNSFGSGCMYGSEFLVWIPELKKFCTFYCCSNSARAMSGGVNELTGQLATLSSLKKKNKKGVWYAPKIVPSNAPLVNVPSEELVTSTVADFLADTGSDQELVEEDTSSRR